MTLTDTKNLLYKHFLENDKLILPEDFNKLIIVSEYPEFDLEILKIALKSYEEVGLIKSFEYKDGKTTKIGYSLDRPLQSFEQDLKIGGDMAHIISNTINSIGQSVQGVQGYESNPLAITSLDIESLVIIISAFMTEKQDSLKNVKEEEED